MSAALADIGCGVTSGSIHSLQIVIEVRGEQLPRTALFGRFGREPYRALAAIERARVRVNHLVDRIERHHD